MTDLHEVPDRQEGPGLDAPRIHLDAPRIHLDAPRIHLDAPRIQLDPLDLDSLVAGTERPDCGALATFTGVVRDHQDGRAVLRLSYTAHETMADKLIRQIETQIAADHDVPVCRVIHRVGDLEIGDAAIIAVVRSAHRAECFAALAAVVEAVKHTVPIWKEEFYVDGTRAFVQGCALETPAASPDLAAADLPDA